MSDPETGDLEPAFDETNGVVEGLEGESDGTAEGEDFSAGDRDENEPEVLGDGATVDGDDSGVDDLRDPNP